jgi:hypothetical protein
MAIEPSPAILSAPSADSADDIFFRMEVSVVIPHLTAIRRFVNEVVASVVRDEGLASRLALTTHELLENAVKYTVNPKRPVTLQLCAMENRQMRVTVLNASSQPLYVSLKERIHQISEAPDPMAYYQRLILESMELAAGSGLGLGRLRAEAQMELGCELVGDMLAVTACTTIGAP